jgi:hypothetical protein
MLIDKSYDRVLCVRLEDYFNASRHWCRQLWRVGSILEVSELLESWEANQRGALSDAAVQYLGKSTCRRVKNDLGFGSEKQRGALIDHLQRKLVPQSHDAEAVRLLLCQHRENYLGRWADAVRSNPGIPVEVLSRAVGSHLMDEGFSRRHLSRWLKYQARREDRVLDAYGLVTLAHELVQRDVATYEILIPVLAIPPFESCTDASWLTSSETVAWLEKNFPDQTVRQSGSFHLSVDARDLPSATGIAADEVVKLLSRFRVGARKRLEFSPNAYIVGFSEPMSYKRAPRRVQVHGLQHTNAVFDRSLPGNMDAVLELLEPLDEGTPAAAVNGCWAALEAMFVGQGDTRERVSAATRMARILACSYAVSELSALAAAYVTGHSDELSSTLRSLPTGVDQARVMEGRIRSGSDIEFDNARHSATLERMRQLIESPDSILPRITGQLDDVFRRLYRQRNLIVHAGELTSAALRGCLRTAAPLTGAGVDRVVRASALRGLAPLQLAAQAEVELGQVGDRGVYLSDLLS